MQCYILDSLDAAFNLAVEEAILRSEFTGLMLWRNNPSVIIGQNQNLEEEVNVEFIRRANFPVIRRKSGGGAVFHDLGNINFSFFCTIDGSVSELLSAFVRLLECENSRTERNDVLVRDRKIIGTAQYRWKNRRVFHGSFLYDVDLPFLARVLTPSVAKLQRHGVSSVRSRVANFRELNSLTYSASEFLKVLQSRFLRDAENSVIHIPAGILECAKVLKQKHYPNALTCIPLGEG